MTSQYKHLGLARWPFEVVPQRESCTFIADRKQLRADTAELLESLSRRPTSSIHLFWAWYGAGKTHTLFYLANRAAVLGKDTTRNALYTAYTEFPKAASTFLDLYRSFLTELDVEILIEAFLEVTTSGLSSQSNRKLMLAMSSLRIPTSGPVRRRMERVRWMYTSGKPGCVP